MYDVMVVEARVAGASTAQLLARRGLKVLAVDRASFPSDTLSTHRVEVPGAARLRSRQFEISARLAARYGVGCPTRRAFMPSPRNIAEESNRHLATVLTEVLKQLRPHQIRAAAENIRRLPADDDGSKFYAGMADAIEQEAGARAIQSLRPPPGEEIPDTVGALGKEDAAAVVALPQIVRGVMFNVHGEPLVYGTDDVVYHGDAEWQGFAVDHGEARGLILDSYEQAFVGALWHSGEEIRKGKAKGSD